MRIPKPFLLVITTLNVLLCLSCARVDIPYSRLDPHCEEWLKHDSRLISFYDRPAARALPLETQFAMYLCGTQRVYPPAFYLIKPISERGEGAIPFLKMQLSTTTEYFVIADIISLLGSMQGMGTYECVDDPEIFALIHNAPFEDPPKREMESGPRATITPIPITDGSIGL